MYIKIEESVNILASPIFYESEVSIEKTPNQNLIKQDRKAPFKNTKVR